MSGRVGPFASGLGWLICWLGFHKKDFYFGYTVTQDEGEGYEGGFSCLRCGLVLRRKTK